MCVFKESDALWVYADGGARDPSVLSCNRTSKREEGNQDTKAWDTVWLVMAFICAKGTRIATPRLVLNRCQGMSIIKSSMTSRLVSATARSGGKRHRDAAAPRGEKITRHGCVRRMVPSALA